MASGRIGMVVRDHALAQQGFDNRRTGFVGQFEDFLSRSKRPLPHEKGDLRSGIDDLRRFLQAGRRRQRERLPREVAAMLRHVQSLLYKYRISSKRRS
jgi:hypothetical protein